MDLERLTPKVESAVERLCGALGSWDEVDAVALLLSGDDLYDPYFFLSLDVYTNDPVRGPEDRRRAFGEVTVFESSPLTHKDRFLVGEIPFRAEYKQTARFDQLVAEAHAGRSILREGGTYAFHRVVTARELYASGSWFADIRSKMSALPTAFWDDLRANQAANAEHTYADLSAAAVRGDELYFAISAGRFVTAICSLLFAVNKQLEPSPRALYDEVAELPTVPDSFPANLENFVGVSSLSMGQRRELAEIMVTSVMSLYGSR
ncbi:MAG: hypothetical protein ACLFP4_10605 [Spirochaetales bacterium]